MDLAWSSSARQCLFLDSVSSLPTTSTAYLPLVRPTFMRRMSARKPMPLVPPARTREMRMISFSLPWKPSTVLSSTSSVRYTRQRAEESSDECD